MNNQLQERVLNSFYNPAAWYDGETLQLYPPARDNLTTSLYAVDQMTSGVLEQWFPALLQFNNTPQNELSESSTNEACLYEISMLYEPLHSETAHFVNPVEDSDIPAFFDTLSAGMTTHVRKGNMTAESPRDGKFTSRLGVEQANGISWIMQAQVHVRWAVDYTTCDLDHLGYHTSVDHCAAKQEQKSGLPGNLQLCHCFPQH